MVVSDAAAIVILGLAGTTGTFLALGWNLRWDRVLARWRERTAIPRPAIPPDASRREAPAGALGEAAR